MRITREKPEILRFVYRQETGDPNYGSCLWAIFDIDPGRGMLNIQGDCGNYAYRWPERGEMFMKMLAGGMSEDYLLKKLCGKPKAFKAEATIENMKDYLKDAEYYEDEKLNQLKIDNAIKNLEAELSEYDLEDDPSIAEFIIDNWNSDNDMDIDCAWELVIKDYSAHQKRTVHIFLEHIAPQIGRATEDGYFHEAKD